MHWVTGLSQGLTAGRTLDVARLLLDHQLDVGTPTLVAHDLHVFETHQGGEDPVRMDKDEGASCFRLTPKA
jgi:hypothetical protein